MASYLCALQSNIWTNNKMRITFGSTRPPGDWRSLLQNPQFPIFFHQETTHRDHSSSHLTHRPTNQDILLPAPLFVTTTIHIRWERQHLWSKYLLYREIPPFRPRIQSSCPYVHRQLCVREMINEETLGFDQIWTAGVGAFSSSSM